MKNGAKKYSISYFIFACSVVLCVLWSTFTLAWAADSSPVVYISQVQITGGAGRTGEDFVELFNPGNEPFNLKGYRLVKRTANGTADVSIKSWTDDAIIPPKSFYLWANSGFTGIAAVPDVVTSATLAGDNGIALRLGAEDSGEIMDSAAWGAAANGFTVVSVANPEAGQALARDSLYQPGSAFTIVAGNPRNTSYSHTGDLPIVDTPSATTTPTSTPISELDNVNNSATTTPTSTQESVIDQLSESNQTLNTGSGIQFVVKSLLVKIAALLPNPTGEDSGNEQVVLENTGNEHVDLNGWLVGDRTDGGVKSSALQLSGVTLAPLAKYVVTVPKGRFALNNTGGDAVNLYFADKAQADSVTYLEDAPEGRWYRNIGGAWTWDAPNAPASQNAITPTVSQAYTLRINEIMANPSGPDEGKEWVELYNYDEVGINVKGLRLDDAGNGGQPSGSALVLESAAIPAYGYAVFAIPEDAFVLNNNLDTVRLFAPGGALIDSVFYREAGESKSYSRSDSGSWVYAFVTPGSVNIIELPEYNFTISEILPNPGEDQDEFIELENSGDKEIDLKGFILAIGSREKKFEQSVIIPGRSFFTIYSEDLPIQLRNSGQEITITDPYERLLDKVTYPKAAAGQSYAKDGQGVYSWTSEPTPGTQNGLVLGASTDGEAAAEELVPAKKQAADKSEVSYAQLYRAVTQSNAELAEKVRGLEEVLGAMSVMSASAAEGDEAVVAEADIGKVLESPARPPGNKNLYVIIIVLSFSLLAVLIKQFFSAPKAL